MAPPDPEIQLAQRLASNEKPIRSKAIKKLRTYINVRSHKVKGAFTGDELLKLWKGLFYCLWMQDKPLLQEELSHHIAALLHSFQTLDAQFLFLETFFQTVKREWTGIDRLRMDKFFQLVRFVVRQAFEMLKRQDWDSSSVSRMLSLLRVQVLQADSQCPAGLRLHILDLYLTELGATGAQELTADQNLVFIEPFCKAVAKTRDGVLFQSICRSVFSVIIDQAPFAIEDLMRELKTKAGDDEDNDSGQGEESDEGDVKAQADDEAIKTNGCKSHEDEDVKDDFGDSDIGPVLQFDYSALADRLFDVARHNNTPGPNRQKLYRIIKVLRDLSEGVFPQDQHEEVSTDEDDQEMFGSRKRMRRGRGQEEEGPGTKRKGKDRNTDQAQTDGQADATEVQKKKSKRKKKAVQRPPGETKVQRPPGETEVQRPLGETKVQRPPGETEDQRPPGETEVQRPLGKTNVTVIEDQLGETGGSCRRRRRKRAAETQVIAISVETEAPPPATVQTPQKKRKQEVKVADGSGVSSQKKKKTSLAAVTVATSKNTTSQAAEGRVKGQDEVRAGGKKKKIPVTFEFEAESMMGNGVQQACKTPPQKKNKKACKDFVTFQKKLSLPTPLLCRTRNKVCWTPESQSKKVTFGLNNNQTAEFKKSDRSLLLSPDRARVPFDPQQKPKCGVLKSPPSLPPTTSRKTPRKGRRAPCRPTAADFF